MTVREGPVERPNLGQFSDMPVFNTKAVVQQTGVPAATLRAWERRYNLLAPERANNTYRLYSERDIYLIRWLKERVDSGMAISQAVALFKHKDRSDLEEGASLDNSHSQADEQDDSQQCSKDNAAFHIASQQDGQPTKQENERAYFAEWPKLSDETAQHRVQYPTTHNMRVVRDRLVEAFTLLDESMANMIMGSMLVIYSVEQVCTELIAPTMWRIGQLWVENQLNVSVEHFASNFFRALLTNLFHIAPSPSRGPIAIVCCAPGEPHELAPLMLALFLRRRGVRVVYLGQSIEITSLLQTIRKLTPALVCISLTMPSYLSAIIDLGRQLEEMPPPRPIFAFGGQVFAQYASIIPQIPGLYLTGDLQDIVEHLHAMLHSRNVNSN